MPAEQLNEIRDNGGLHFFLVQIRGLLQNLGFVLNELLDFVP